MTRARDFLLAVADAGGNAMPMIGAGRRLIASGHRVRVMADRSLRSAVERTGAGFEPWQQAPGRADHSVATDVLRDWEASSPVEGLERLRDRLMIGPAAQHAADVLAVLEAQPADAVVSSDLIFGPMLAAEAAGVPWAVLASNLCYLSIPGIPPFGPGLMPPRNDDERRLFAGMPGMEQLLAPALPVLNAARTGLGLSPLREIMAQPASARRFLIATCPEFDFPAEGLPEAIRYVGPILDEPDWAAALPTRFYGPSTVLVAFSTTFQNHAAVIQRVIDALATLPVAALVTLGPALDADAISAHPNTRILPGASHDAILPQTDLVVTHAGHGTVMRALSHGVPMLCLPMGRDQADNAARVAFHGAGLRLDAGSDAAALRGAIHHLLDTPAFRARAQELEVAVRRWSRARNLEDELEALVV